MSVAQRFAQVFGAVHVLVRAGAPSGAPALSSEGEPPGHKGRINL